MWGVDVQFSVLCDSPEGMTAVKSSCSGLNDGCGSIIRDSGSQLDCGEWIPSAAGREKERMKSLRIKTSVDQSMNLSLKPQDL